MLINICKFFNSNQKVLGLRSLQNKNQIDSPILNNNVIEQIGFEVHGLEEQTDEGYFDIPLQIPFVPKEAPMLYDFTYYLTGSVIFQSSEFEPLIEDSDTLFSGSDFNIEDIIIILELIKTTNNLGDTVESIILGMLASFLPTDNIISNKIKENSGTLFYFQKLIKESQKHIPKCSVHRIDVCIKGCMAFVGDNLYANFCEECGKKRNLLKPFQRELFYFPIRERLTKLLTSDLKNLLEYPNRRSGRNNDFWDDVYDGQTYKRFEALMDPTKGERLLALQYCWDGADAFNFSGKSFWPGCVSILNFPKDLRSKLHIGLFVVSLCDGNI